MMKRHAIELTLFVAVVIGAAFAQVPTETYAVGFLPNIPDHYVLASLADLSSMAFLEQYNSVGLSFVEPFPAAAATCCVVSVAEGYLSIGSSDANSNYLEPFYSNGTATCASLSQPLNTTFGVPATFPGPYEGTWISLLTPKEQYGFRVTGKAPLDGSCSNGNPFVVILKSMPKYFFQPQGPNYRAPNASFYEVATLNDIHTMNFLEYYNSQQGLLILEPQQQIQQWFCCLVRVADGWLYYGAPPNAYSPLTLTDGFSSANVCSIYNNYNNAVVTLGTTTTTNVNFNTLTLAEISQFGSFTTGSQCTAPDNEFGNNTITLYKRVSPPPYLITLYGPGVPLPSASYALATLADVQSEAFGAAYNAAGGINVTGFESDISMCCVLQVTEGWLYNTNPGYYPLSPYTTGLAPNHEACAAFMSSQLSLIGIMGGAEVGFTTLNSTTTSHFTTNSTNPCSSTITSIAILKRLY